MKLSHRLRAVIWGLSVGVLFTAGWYLFVESGAKGEPVLMPEQSRSVIVVGQVKTAAMIFVFTSVPGGLLAFYRPTRKGDQ